MKYWALRPSGSTAITVMFSRGIVSASLSMPSGAARTPAKCMSSGLQAILDEKLGGQRGGACGAEHRVYDDGATGEFGRELLVVESGQRRLFIALHADDADGRVGQRFGEGGQNRHRRAQDGNERYVVGGATPSVWASGVSTRTRLSASLEITSAQSRYASLSEVRRNSAVDALLSLSVVSRISFMSGFVGLPGE